MNGRVLNVLEPTELSSIVRPSQNPNKDQVNRNHRGNNGERWR